MRHKTVFGRFRRDKSGATAIEFALVAMPFFMLLLAIIEHSMLYFGAQTLDNAMLQTARLIRTGQVQAQGLGEAEFRELICAEINFIMSCGDRLQIDVRRFNNFAGINNNSPLDNDGNFSGNTTFEPGSGGEIVLVRIFYAWPLMTPVFSESLANMSDGNFLLQSSAAFRNEPF